MPSETNNATDQTYPVVVLGGVNGNCEVSIGNAGYWRALMIWTGLLVWFMWTVSPDSVSLVTAQQGDVSVTLDRKVEDLRLIYLFFKQVILVGGTGTTIAEEEPQCRW
jgi:hypothetical protein